MEGAGASKTPLHEMDLKVAEMSASVYRVVSSGSFRVGVVDETAASRVGRWGRWGNFPIVISFLEDVLQSYFR
jgi:hypothetical protein